MTQKKISRENEIKAFLKKELKESAKKYEKAKNTVTNKKDLLEKYVKDNPWTSLGIAFMLGYIIGRLKR